MFEITYSDKETFEAYQNAGKAYKKGVYDFTFEHRYIIYHANLRNKVDYIAIDMTTGLASCVITKQPGNLYTEVSYRRMIPHILYSVKYTGDMRYLNRFASDPLEVIDSIFRVVLPNNGYTIREEQISLSKKMFIGFTEKQIALCEAEVGTGKTLSYLVAAIVAKHYNGMTYGQNLPVTITTSSIELQKALVEREIPNLSKMLMDYHIIDEPLTAVLRKGKEHYLCRYRLEDFLKNIRLYPEKYASTIELLEKMADLRAGIDLDRYRISGAIKSRICIKGTCAGCARKKECVYNEFAKRMYNLPDLDFQVTNHNMYLMSQKTKTNDHPPLLRESCFVVVDEAHKFKEAAEDTFGERISEKDILRYVNSVKILCSPKANRDKYKEFLASLIKESEALFNSLRKKQHSDIEEERGNIISLSAFQSGKLNKIMYLIDKVEGMKIKRNYGIPVTGGYLKTAITAINKTSKSTIWLDTDENGVLSLCSTPKDINNILRTKVWDRNVSHVLTSGTISDGTDFEYFKAENGLEFIPHRLLLESRTESPFDYANHTRLYIPKGMPIPDNDSEDYFKSIADEIYKIIQATNGHTAILFTSYKTLSLVHELLKDKLTKYDTICMTRSNKNAITDFKKSKNGILFASGSMWEGVDCVGDCLSSVIIVRLPFPMRSALMEEKKETCDSVGDFVDRYCTPNMLIKLRQGVGRLIRCESDTGVVSILDPRATSKSYSGKVGQALHKFPKVDSTEEIESFMRSVKGESYYAEKKENNE